MALTRDKEGNVMWHITVAPLIERSKGGSRDPYDARSLEEVREKHRLAATILMAACPEPHEDTVIIEGIGEITNFRVSGPLIEVKEW